MIGKLLKGFGVIFVLLLFIGSCAGDTSKPSTEPTNTNTQASTKKSSPSVKTYKSGQYKVGNDIPAGEYIVIANGDSYIEVAKDATGNLDSILANDVFKNRSIISVSNGQFLKVQSGTIYAAADAPKAEVKNGLLPSGMYKVGIDFPAGEYKVISKADNSYIEISSDSTHNLDSIITNDVFTGDRYIQVSDGQYLKFLIVI